MPCPRFLPPFLLAALAGLAPSAHACTVVPLAHPEPSATLDQARPTLRWEGDAAARYRVQVAVVLPEARLLASHDLEVVGTTWTLPAALPLERAALKVIVSRDCPSLQAQDLHARGPAFFVDLRAGCEIPEGGLRVDAGRWHWPPVARAQAYRVRIFRSAGGEASWVPAFQATVAEPAWDPDPADAGSVVTVQPVCEGRAGRVSAKAWP